MGPEIQAENRLTLQAGLTTGASATRALLSRLGNGPAPLLTATFAIALAGLALFVLATLRAPLPVEFNYNEGWNVYFQTALREGRPLYPDEATLTFNNYPPLSFLIVAGLAQGDGDVMLIARLLGLMSILVVSLCAGLTISNLTTRKLDTAYAPAALCFLVLCTAPTDVYVGINDPQMLAHAFMAVAIAIYTRKPESRAHLAWTIVFLGLGGMVKHNLIAEPLAIGLDVLLRSRPRAVRFAAFAALWLGLCALFMHLISDGRIWSSLASPRTYELAKGLRLTAWSLGPAMGLLCIGAIALLGRPAEPGPRFVGLYFATAVLVGLAFSGGAGTNINLYFSVFIAAVLGVGLLVADLSRPGAPSVAGLGAQSLAALLMLAAGASTAFASAPRLMNMHIPARVEAAVAADRAFLAARPGDAICSFPYLCVSAGKGMIYDPFSAGQAELTRPETAARIDVLLRDERVRTIVLTQDEADLVLSEAPLTGAGGALLRTARADFILLRRAEAGSAFFGRRAEAAPSE